LAIKDLGVSDRVVLRGAMDRSGCREEMARADLFILSSVTEAFGLAAAEAMATGLPVIASAVGGLTEVVAEGVTGFLVPSRDPGALADRIIGLAEDPEMRREMGKAGRERVRSRFDRDLIVAQLVSTYEKVIKERRGR
jgi:type III pantothenate kinase